MKMMSVLVTLLCLTVAGSVCGIVFFLLNLAQFGLGSVILALLVALFSLVLIYIIYLLDAILDKLKEKEP